MNQTLLNQRDVSVIAANGAGYVSSTASQFQPKPRNRSTRCSALLSQYPDWRSARHGYSSCPGFLFDPTWNFGGTLVLDAHFPCDAVFAADKGRGRVFVAVPVCKGQRRRENKSGHAQQLPRCDATRSGVVS